MRRTGSPCPCQDCTERHLKCHGNCERYARFQKEEQEARDAIKEAKGQYVMADSYEVHRIQNYKKRMNVK